MTANCDQVRPRAVRFVHATTRTRASCRARPDRAAWTGSRPFRPRSSASYSKTLRTIPGWVPAAQAELVTIVNDWLDGELNTSVFTNDTLDGAPTSRRDQIRRTFNGPLDSRPDEAGLRTMWGGLMRAISEQKDLELRKESLRTLIGQGACDLIAALRGVLPDPYLKVLALNSGGFEAVYSSLKPPEDRGNPDAQIDFNQSESAKLLLWIKHLDHALTALKSARFGKDPTKPYSLMDQFKAITGDPAVMKTAQGPMSLQQLKSALNQRARERLGGADVDLSKVDPRRLDGALFAAEVRAALEEKRQERLASVARLEQGKKAVLARYSPV